VVEGVHEHRSGAIGELARRVEALIDGGPTEVHRCAVPAGRGDLGQRACSGMNTVAADAEFLRGERDPLRVVARAGGDDPRPRCPRRDGRSACRRRGS
jgi:hypothetical protein